MIRARAYHLIAPEAVGLRLASAKAALADRGLRARVTYRSTGPGTWTARSASVPDPFDLDREGDGWGCERG